MSRKTFVDEQGHVHEGEQQVLKSSLGLPPPSAGRRILVCVDGSRASERALAHALWMLRSMPQDELLLFHCHVTPPEPMEGSWSLVPANPAEDALLAIVSYYSQATTTNVQWSRKTVQAPDAREAIVKEAEEWGAHYVVLGARGQNLGQVRSLRMPVGSTCDYVVRNAPCSTIVVRKNQQ